MSYGRTTYDMTRIVSQLWKNQITCNYIAESDCVKCSHEFNFPCHASLGELE